MISMVSISFSLFYVFIHSEKCLKQNFNDFFSIFTH